MREIRLGWHGNEVVACHRGVPHRGDNEYTTTSEVEDHIASTPRRERDGDRDLRRPVPLARWALGIFGRWGEGLPRGTSSRLTDLRSGINTGGADNSLVLKGIAVHGVRVLDAYRLPVAIKRRNVQVEIFFVDCILERTQDLINRLEMEGMADDEL
jgi:hypothetical protein